MSLLKGHPSRDVFLFVHGFNTSFNFGVRGSAVKGRALKKSLTVCLTWPSNPPGEGAGWLIKRVRTYTALGILAMLLLAMLLLLLLLLLVVVVVVLSCPRVIMWLDWQLGTCENVSTQPATLS